MIHFLLFMTSEYILEETTKAKGLVKVKRMKIWGLGFYDFLNQVF